MKFLPKNTLAYYNSAPQFHRHDLSQLPVEAFGKATKEYRKDCGEVSPNNEAVSFYVLNHCAAIVRKSFTLNEPLPQWAEQVMGLYMKTLMGQGKRMLHYILSITTREMRHLHSGSVTDAFWKKMEQECGVEMPPFIKSICGASENQAVSSYMNNPPDAGVGKYMKAMSYAFHKGQWSGGYGGSSWGNVTDAAVSMLYGKTSMEMLVDTGYTLAHNNGPIFNKGMMYSHHDSNFICILDVQRSGQMPELILDKQSYGVHKTPEAVQAVQLITNAKPEEFRGWVDWGQVKKLGAVGSYAKFEQKQKQLHPEPLVGKKAQEKMIHGKKVKIVGEWMVAPNQACSIYERVA